MTPYYAKSPAVMVFKKFPSLRGFFSVRLEQVCTTKDSMIRQRGAFISFCMS